MTVNPYLDSYDDVTPEQELKVARTARLKILALGQSNNLRQNELRRAALKDVNALIKDLEAIVSATSGRTYNHVRLRSPSTIER